MDYMAAAQVINAGDVPGYLHTLIIPSRKVAVFTHQGGLETLSDTWGRIFSEGLPQAKLNVAPGPQFEVYSEDFDADAGQGSVQIHIPVPDQKRPERHGVPSGPSEDVAKKKSPDHCLQWQVWLTSCSRPQ